MIVDNQLLIVDNQPISVDKIEKSIVEKIINSVGKINSVDNLN